MACYHPKPARQMAGRMRLGVAPQYATHWLPCGSCIGCIEAQALTWAIRLKHESRSHSHSTFLTLTYDVENEPNGLSIPHMQAFWKRLRRKLPATIKVFYCGEYGDKTKRPHYHAAVFNYTPFPDSKKWDTENTVSETLNAIWGKGRVTQSELTPYRMAYVTGYVLKKAGYKRQVYCDVDGVELQAPFRRMSQGLGKNWLQKYASDLRHGCVHHDGYKVAVPRYYQDILKKALNVYGPKTLQEIHYAEQATLLQSAKDERRANMEQPDRDRCRAAEQIRHQQIKKRKRDRI